MSTTELKVPDIGDFDKVDVIEVLVAVGDTIKAEQSLVTVESDKASMEIPAEQGGVVAEVLVKVGDKVAQGDALVRIEASEAEAAEASSTDGAAPQAAAASASSAQQDTSAPERESAADGADHLPSPLRIL